MSSRREFIAHVGTIGSALAVGASLPGVSQGQDTGTPELPKQPLPETDSPATSPNSTQTNPAPTNSPQANTSPGAESPAITPPSETTPATPPADLTLPKSPTPPQDPATEAKNVHLVKANEGNAVWLLGTLVRIKAMCGETAGCCASWEQVIYPGAGIPSHLHTREIETWYLLEGELEWHVGDKSYTAQGGDFLSLPRNVPHHFSNKSANPARMLVTYAPANFESWLLEVGQPAANPLADPPAITAEELKKAVAAAEKYGVKFTPLR
ncbi:MAG: cupin domain-containing protein [Pirellulales bacterium]|nr:cupin domain-containing protein [Pirellulales bacterium]